MRRYMATLIVVMMALGVVTAPAMAHDFPSDNDTNRTNDWAHVNELDVGIGWVNLECVNPRTNVSSGFEYRIDGELVTSGRPHQVVLGDFNYPAIRLDNRGGPGPMYRVETFEADSKVEIRKAGGGERDEDFDWTTFEVLPDAQSKDGCKDGGYAAFGFNNQGQCIKFVNTGKDSRQ